MNMQNVLSIPDSGNTDESRILTLTEKLRATIWSLDEDSEALGTAMCALVLRLNPFISSRMIADALPYGDEKFDLVAFVNVMSNIGYRYSRFSTKLSDLDPRLTPAVILRGEDRNSECPKSPSVAWSQDDGYGNEQIIELNCDDFILAPTQNMDETVTVLVFQRIEEAKLATSSTRREMAGYGWFRALMQRFKGQVRQIMVLGLLLNLISLLVPVLILLVYDRVIGPKTAEPLAYLAIGGIIVAFSEFLLRRARSHMLAWFSSRIDYLVGGAIFEHLLRLPPALVQKASVSDQIARVKTFEAVRDFFCGPVLIMSLELPATVASGLILWFIAGPMVAVPIVAALTLSCIFWSTWRQVRIRIREAAIESSIMQQFSIDTFEKLESIRLDGLSAQWAQKFRDISARELLAQHKLNQVGIRGELVAQFVMGMTMLVGLAFGAQLIWDGEMGTGVLIAGMMLVWRILAPFHSLCGLVPRFEQTRNAIIQIDKLMETGVESQAEVSTIATNRLSGAVTFKNVALRYPGSTSLVFNSLDFEVRPGEVLCVTGPNGAGKTSLLKLVLGLETPQIGSVKIDGFDIRQFDPRELREQIAFVPQDVDIISGTIAENLRLALPLADDDRLRSALELVGAWDEVSQLPDGLHSYITPKQEGEQQTTLFQRIGLARGMLKKSKVLLIDEQPSSLLLNGLDENLKNCIRTSSSNRTTIFVSYRTDMLRHADRVIAFRPGLKPVIGSPDKIMELN